MRILVLYGNDSIFERAKPIFECYDHKWIFLKDIDFDDCYDFDMIFSLHCKKIFPKELVTRVKCINVHPGYNPYNRGMFPHVWSIINGLPAGATIHEMDEGIDTGLIIAQRHIPITPHDTSETLYNRIVDAELSLLTLNLGAILENDYLPTRPVERGNYNSLEDFKNLCNITDEHQNTINLLRALTHGDYKNAKLGNRHLKLEIL